MAILNNPMAKVARIALPANTYIYGLSLHAFLIYSYRIY